MMIKFLRHSMLAIALIVGFSMTATAQKKDDPPPKERPPVIVPNPDKKPKEDKPKGDKKPGGEFVAYIEKSVFE